MSELVGKIVEVMSDDLIYTGKLVEMGELEVHLETEYGWVVIPVEKIAYIKEKNE